MALLNSDELPPDTPRANGSTIHDEETDPSWLRGRILADEAINTERHEETKVRLDAQDRMLVELKAAVEKLSGAAPSQRERYFAWILLTVATTLLGVLAKRWGVDFDPSTVQLPR